MVKKNEFLNEIIKKIKRKCNDLEIKLRFDKIENEGGLCKYKDKIFIIINKFFNDSEKIEVFFTKIKKTDFYNEFKEIEKEFNETEF